MASVLPRKNPGGTVSWRVSFRIDGRQAQESFSTEKAASSFGKLVDRVGGRAAREARLARESKSVGVPTLAEYTMKYLDLDSGLLTGIAAGTRKDYVGIAGRSFLEILGELPVTSIEKSDVGRWVAWQEAQPSARNAKEKVAAKTVSNYHALLSSVMASVVVDGKYRPDNPAYKTRLSRGTPRKPVFLSPTELSTFMHFAPAQHRALLTFLVGTGCRWGEATAVTWGDIETATSPATVSIDKAWVKSEDGPPALGPPKTPKSVRPISLWPEILAVLGPRRAPSQLVFQGAVSGNHIWYGSFMTRVWNPTVAKAQDRSLCAVAGLAPLEKSPTPHDLRHTHASLLIARGAPLPYIQARLGHEKITTTIDVYGHLLPDAHAQMADIMQGELSGILPLHAELEAS